MNDNATYCGEQSNRWICVVVLVFSLCPAVRNIVFM
jgi:hypothetical protein